MRIEDIWGVRIPRRVEKTKTMKPIIDNYLAISKMIIQSRGCVHITFATIGGGGQGYLLHLIKERAGGGLKLSR